MKEYKPRMHSINYYWSKTPLLRKLLQWKTSLKVNKFRQKEYQRQERELKNLRNFEKKVFSQNGEDGILEEIFNRIGVTDKFFVEFGVEDGSECNGRYLIEKCGWSGLWMDGSKENVEAANKNFSKFPIDIRQKFITQENINSLFEEASVKNEFDLLSIDIDGNDYWVWQKLLRYKPRVVVIEYNASFVPGKEWIMPYRADHLYDGSNFFGASLESLNRLGKKKGYSLVGCDSEGVNAFFVRDDLVGKYFPDSSKGVNYHYCAPKYRKLFFGHPKGSGPWRS